MRLERVSGEGKDARYDLFYKRKKIASSITLEQLKAAIDRLEQEHEVKRHG